jgi:hypothetical protein
MKLDIKEAVYSTFCKTWYINLQTKFGFLCLVESYLAIMSQDKNLDGMNVG